MPSCARSARIRRWRSSILSATFVHLHGLVAQVEALKAADRGAAGGESPAGAGALSKAGACEKMTLPYDKVLIAGRLGMKPESLSRAFARLKEQGVGRAIKQNTATIEDVAVLRRACRGRSGAGLVEGRLKVSTSEHLLQDVFNFQWLGFFFVYLILTFSSRECETRKGGGSESVSARVESSQPGRARHDRAKVVAQDGAWALRPESIRIGRVERRADNGREAARGRWRRRERGRGSYRPELWVSSAGGYSGPGGEQRTRFSHVPEGRTGLDRFWRTKPAEPGAGGRSSRREHARRESRSEGN